MKWLTPVNAAAVKHIEVEFGKKKKKRKKRVKSVISLELKYKDESDNGNRQLAAITPL